MLGFEDFEEDISKRPFGTFALAGNRNGLVCACGGLVFDQLFKVVVVNVVCIATWSVVGSERVDRKDAHSDPILGLTFVVRCRRISCQRVRVQRSDCLFNWAGRVVREALWTAGWVWGDSKLGTVR